MVLNAIERKFKVWNPWHGCHKLSAGCKYCYVYRGDSNRGIDSSIVSQTKNFDLPIQRKRTGEYKITSGSMVYSCFTSDFFIEEADEWRVKAWEMIRLRNDLRFMMITKRIDRLHESLPDDWGEGYEHVTICCTVENQERADYRLPLYKDAPIRHKIIICEPLLEKIDLRPFDIGSWVEQVVAGGESGYNARSCDFDWVMNLRDLCVEQNVSFWFKQTGAKFIKNGRVYSINRRLQHSQARRAGINFSSLPLGNTPFFM
jgi:Bacteriophage protein gp37